jgi:hypothetical protein
MEDDLELEIAELVGKRFHVIASVGVRDFVRFLDGVGRDRVERLDAVPFAAADGVAKPLHDLHQPLERHTVPRLLLYFVETYGGGLKTHIPLLNL